MHFSLQNLSWFIKTLKENGLPGEKYPRTQEQLWTRALLQFRTLRLFMVHLKSAKYFTNTPTTFLLNVKERKRTHEGFINMVVLSPTAFYLACSIVTSNHLLPGRSICKLHQNDSGQAGQLVSLESWKQLEKLSFVMSCWFLKFNISAKGENAQILVVTAIRDHISFCMKDFKR